MGKFITNSWANSYTWAHLLQIQIHGKIQIQIHGQICYKFKYRGKFVTNSNTWANLLQIQIHGQIHEPQTKVKILKKAVDALAFDSALVFDNVDDAFEDFVSFLIMH